MPFTPTSLLLTLLLLTPLTLAAPSPPKEDTPLSEPVPIHLHSYANPSTSSHCNLECRRIFCNSVSQFLESVTCTSHRPCLSLNLQFKIQEKCLDWRPEIHYGSAATAIDRVAAPVASKVDAVAVSSKGAMDPDCGEGAMSPSAPVWVKAYVPAAIGYEWLRKGAASTTMPVVEGEVNKKTEVFSAVGVLRWVCLVGAVVALLCAWKVKDRRLRKVVVDRWAKGKGEM